MSGDYRKLAETIFSLRFESMPVWVDDRRIAFLDDRSGVAHLFVGDVVSGERHQLTSGVERIQSLYGAAGVRHVVVGTDAGGNERQQLLVVDLETGDQRRLTANPDLMHEPFLLTADGTRALYRTNDGGSGEFSLYSIDLASGEATSLWFDAGQVRAHAITESGDMLVSILTSNLDADLYILSPDGTSLPLLQVEDESWIVDATFAGDGSVLVLTNAGRDFVQLVRIDRKTRELEPLVGEEADIEAMALSNDGSRIAWSLNRDGYSVIHIAAFEAMHEPVVATLPDGVVDRISWSPDGAAVAIGWTPTTGPARIWLIDASDGSAKPAFDIEDQGAGFEGAAPELIHFETFDGRQIPAFWFESNQRDAPVVIDVHGGPESQRRPGFHPVLQHLLASGFHVLTTNVRGSTGYGKAYSHLDDVELRMDSVRDLPHAHAWVVSRLGGDPKIGIMGQSYGGFMTLAAVTEYPELWFAAVDVVGIANFVTFLERTGTWRRRHRSAEYGSLEHHRDLLERISPIRKVDEIRAPMLVIHGRNDPRVPLYEAEQLVASLERRDHPVELLVFDNEGHGLSKRSNRITGYTRVAEFFHKQASAPGSTS
ncbi:MAG TPA: alpha/beta fold hydrolase [Thermomicrobiales bacterium]|nr:alpha/beta fold hydrolase [Thermomicrobiales bacterium]